MKNPISDFANEYIIQWLPSEQLWRASLLVPTDMNVSIW